MPSALTWFRRDSRIAWFAPTHLEEILHHIGEQMFAEIILATFCASDPSQGRTARNGGIGDAGLKICCA